MTQPTVATGNMMVLPINAPRYEHPVSHDVFIQPAYEARISQDLIYTPNNNYAQALASMPEGTRMSCLEEIAYLVDLEKKLKSEGKSPREALNDPIFDRFIKGNPYKWQHTAVALRAPKGAESLSTYPEKHQGRDYVRADYLRGNKVVAEGVPIPVSRGGKVVEWVPSLWIPAAVSDGVEPDHTSHWYIDTSKNEVSVQLGGDRYGGVPGRCRLVYALYGRSDANSGAASRAVQGSLDDVPSLVVEFFVKDRESFDKGVSKGIRETRAELADELRALLKRYEQ